jgi:hypothetical protein
MSQICDSESNADKIALAIRRLATAMSTSEPKQLWHNPNDNQGD